MKITLQPALLQWARQRAGLREADLGKKLGIKKAPEDQVEQWEKDGIITYSRVQKIAKITHTPFGYLFLSTPPVEVLPVADFRTVGSEDAAPRGRSLLGAALRDARVVRLRAPQCSSR